MRGGVFLMKANVWWKSGPGSYFNKIENILLTDLGSRKSSYKNLIESPNNVTKTQQNRYTTGGEGGTGRRGRAGAKTKLGRVQRRAQARRRKPPQHGLNQVMAVRQSPFFNCWYTAIHLLPATFVKI
jgi:hypothetical protein